jgi:hypothetical protein
MKNLIILPCCSSKIPGGVAYQPANVTFFDDPNNQVITGIVNRRNLLMAAQEGLNVAQFMPAWCRYDGVIVGRLKRDVLNLITQLYENNCIDIIFISALYGAINVDTQIANYDLLMPINPNFEDRWSNTISNAVNEYCQLNEISNIYTFLRPDTYYRALNGNNNFCDRPHLQSWPVGIRGANNVNARVAEMVIERLLMISELCKNTPQVNARYFPR